MRKVGMFIFGVVFLFASCEGPYVELAPDEGCLYQEERFDPDLVVYRSNCRIKSPETLVFIGGFVDQGAWDKF